MTIKKEKSNHWRRLINQWRQSGLTKKEFCKREKITTHSLGYWITRTNKEDHSHDQDHSSSFAKVIAPVKKENVFSINLPKGISLTFAQTPDPIWVAQILAIMSGGNNEKH